MFSHRKAYQATKQHSSGTGSGYPRDAAPSGPSNPDAHSVSDEYIRLNKRQEARIILLERKRRADALDAEARALENE
eukprot:13227187-Heterocapsa_arctica.AAC.1